MEGADQGFGQTAGTMGDDGVRGCSSSHHDSKGEVYDDGDGVDQGLHHRVVLLGVDVDRMSLCDQVQFSPRIFFLNTVR